MDPSGTEYSVHEPDLDESTQHEVGQDMER